ncbi:MAG: hypothetical protein NTX11_02995 [Candidatus Saccharibacteria bacterium]|nr:hypothetical protein [Candidatus Saccharibacteria bacterium]
MKFIPPSKTATTISIVCAAVMAVLIFSWFLLQRYTPSNGSPSADYKVISINQSSCNDGYNLLRALSGNSSGVHGVRCDYTYRLQRQDGKEVIWVLKNTNAQYTVNQNLKLYANVDNSGELVPINPRSRNVEEIISYISIALFITPIAGMIAWLFSKAEWKMGFTKPKKLT